MVHMVIYGCGYPIQRMKKICYYCGDCSMMKRRFVPILTTFMKMSWTVDVLVVVPRDEDILFSIFALLFM